jgi:hypothetical protein
VVHVGRMCAGWCVSYSKTLYLLENFCNVQSDLLSLRVGCGIFNVLFEIDDRPKCL